MKISPFFVINLKGKNWGIKRRIVTLQMELSVGIVIFLHEVTQCTQNFLYFIDQLPKIQRKITKFSDIIVIVSNTTSLEEILGEDHLLHRQLEGGVP
jgi:hypothetical protein